MPLELVLTVIPFLIISACFTPWWCSVPMVHKDPNPEVVVVTAFQWNWKFGTRRWTTRTGTKYDGADPARKAAMVQKPEGVDAHGEERRSAPSAG